MACDVFQQHSPFQDNVNKINKLSNEMSSSSISDETSPSPLPALYLSNHSLYLPMTENIPPISPAGTRRGRQLMTPWLFDQINSGEIPGLVWLDEDAGIFKIPWKLLGRPGVNGDEDALLFRRWAEHTGKFKEGESPNPSLWKTNFRCALSKMKNITKLTHYNQDGDDPSRVYQFIRKQLACNGSLSPLAQEVKIEPTGFDDPGGSQAGGNQGSLRDDLIFEELDDCFNELQFTDPIPGRDYPSFDVNDSVSSESLLHTIQTLSMLENVPKQELSSIKVKLYYADREVGMQIVNNPYGVRIAFRPLPSLPEDVVQGNTQQLNDIFGPSKADQICFPPTDDVCTANILGFLGRGLVLQALNGQILATRLCQARVFYSDSLTTCNNALPREQTIVLFDFANEFYPKLKTFEAGEGPAPTFERYFSLMEMWSEKSPLTSKHVRVTVTHSWAEKLFKQFQNGTSEFFYSAPNDRDMAAHQIELVAQQST